MLFNSVSIFLLLIFSTYVYFFHSCYHYLVNKDVYIKQASDRVKIVAKL